MESGKRSNSLIGNNFGQVAWVVPDIDAAVKFFRETIGVPRFMKMENLKAQDLEGTYQGKPADFEFHLFMTYSGSTMLELIQPISGSSIYKDFLDKHSEGGVQHVAYTVPESDFEQSVLELTDKGYPVVQSLHLPVARVAYFDTIDEIGVSTEIIGVTEQGLEFVEQLKTGNF